MLELVRGQILEASPIALARLSLPLRLVIAYSVVLSFCCTILIVLVRYNDVILVLDSTIDVFEAAHWTICLTSVLFALISPFSLQKLVY